MSNWRLLAADGRFAWRALCRAPGFAVPAVFTIAVAVGVVVAVSSVIDVESLRPFTLSTALNLDVIRDPGWSASWSGSLRSPNDLQRAALDSFLLVLAVAAVVAGVIAALTLANLTLSRAARRGLELAVQSAVGASSFRLLARLGAEGLWLGGVGVGLGLLVGFAAGAAWRLTWPQGAASFGSLPYTSMAAMGVGLPIAIMVALPLLSALASGGRGALPRLLRSGERVTDGRATALLRDGFTVAQFAASLALLVGAGILLRGPVGSDSDTRTAFGTEETLIIKLDLSRTTFEEPRNRIAYFEKLLAGVRGLPSVHDTAVGSSGTLVALGPLGRVISDCGDCSRGGVFLPFIPGIVRYQAISPRFFQVLGVDVSSGREFDEDDRAGSPLVALVSEDFAASHFEGGRAVGREVQLGGGTGPWYRVVGVVPEVRVAGLAAGRGDIPAVYVPLLQDPPSSVDLAVRPAMSVQEMARPVQSLARAIDPGARVVGSATLGEELARQAAPLRWLGGSLGAAAVVSLLLALQGLTSVMRYNVSTRRRELAVRMSVGAGSGSVVWLVLRRTLVIAGAGTVLGLWAALPLVGWARKLVPGASPLDPALVTLIAGALLSCTVLGGALPAWNAARVDPALTLRVE
jgi:predicted permease